MKSKLITLTATALAVGFSAWLGVRAGETETIKTEKSVVVYGTTNAINSAREYMNQGAQWVHIHHKIFDDNTNRWQVEGVFYR